MHLAKHAMAAVLLLAGFAAQAQTSTPLTCTPTEGNATATTSCTWDMIGYSACEASGGWSGTKAAKGTETVKLSTPGDITLTLTCTPNATTTNGAAAISWIPTTLGTDGKPITLSGYSVHYGRSADVLATTVAVNGATTSSHVIENLASGVWFFGVRALTATGAQSGMSSIVSKDISATTSTGQPSIRRQTIKVLEPVPLPPTGLTVIQKTAWDVKRRYWGLFGPYELNARVGTVELGSACTRESVEGHNGVDRSDVTFTRSPRSKLVVARCA